MITQMTTLENRIEILEKDKNERKKLRVTAEILTPIVREIRSLMINKHISDCYYSKVIIHACLLRCRGENISWEISDFNRSNSESKFDFNTFNEFEGQPK